MIPVAPDVAILIVGVGVVAVTGWGAFVSLRSAALGPRWATAHLSKVRPSMWGLIAIAVSLVFLATPPWLGVALAYLGGAVLFLASGVRRMLERMQELGGFDDMSTEHRMAVVARAKRGLTILGFVLIAIGLLAIAVDVGLLSWIIVAMGSVLAANGMLLVPEQSAE